MSGRFRSIPPRTTLLAVLALAAAAVPAHAHAQTVVYLVRHAEPTMDGTADRNLNLAGRERAHALRHVLEEAGITRILSTDLNRTRETAQPLAEALGLTVESYDPGDLPGLAERLRDTPGRVLVAGHSNTTPELVQLLGGDPGEPIDEDFEFDRLYQVVIDADGQLVSSTLLRYGSVSGR